MLKTTPRRLACGVLFFLSVVTSDRLTSNMSSAQIIPMQSGLLKQAFCYRHILSDQLSISN